MQVDSWSPSELVDLGGSRIRPLLPSEPPTPEQMSVFLIDLQRQRVSRVTRQMLLASANQSPVERFISAVKVVMYRLRTTNGDAPDPCLAAEEQFCLEEVFFSSLSPDSKHIATELLCLKERYLLARTMRRAVTELTNPGETNG